MSGQRYLIPEIAEMYRTTIRNVQTWIKSGHLRAVAVGRKPNSKKPRWVVSEDALKEFELSRSSSTPAAPPIRRRKKSEPDVIQFYK